MMEYPTLAADQAGDHAAQLVVTQARRSKHPDLTTWGPDDAAPADGHWGWLAFVVDGEGDTWVRISDGPSKGKWQLRGYKQRLENSRPVAWRELAAAYGPLTTLPGDWYRQRTEILETVASSMSAMEDLLFHAFGAHTLGTDFAHGPLIGERSADGDIVRHAQTIADRLTQQAAAIRKVLASAHLVTEPEQID